MNIDDYLQWVRQSYNSERNGIKKHLFFRGHSKASYKLEPSIFRKAGDDYRYKEREVVLDFKQYAPVHAINYEFPRQMDRILVDMQHYGLPTRLLDWTVAPLNALFFACKESGQSPAQVIVFNPWEYREALVRGKSHPELHQIQIIARSLLAVQNYDSVKAYIQEHFKYNLSQEEINLPFPFVAVFSNQRILHQRGVFTIHGWDQDIYEKFPLFSQYTDRFDIPAENKEDLMQQLSQLYINDYSIYPDFQGMSDAIKRYSSLFTIWNPPKDRPT
jgi:FRG domain